MKFPVKRVGVSAIIVASMIAATVSPALANPVAPSVAAGDSLYAIGFGYSDQTPGSQLLSVDGSNAQVAPIGTGRSNSEMFQSQPAWDAKTHRAYFLENTSPASTLAIMDVATGDSTLAATPFSIDSDPINITAIAINKVGDAFATDGSALYSLDLVTRALAPIATLPTRDVASLAFDPTGTFMYGIDGDNTLFTLTTAGDATPLTTLTLTQDRSAHSLQVDSNGILWVADVTMGASELWSVDPVTFVETESGLLTDSTSSVTYYTQSLLLIPKPDDVAPAITSAAAFTASTRVAFSFTVTATGSPAPTFAVSSGSLPAGVTLDAATGVMSGTATTSGIFTFTITATNSADSSAQSFTLSVIELPVVSG